MRAYTVTGSRPTEQPVTRFAGSNADAAKARREMMNEHSLKMKDIEIKEIDIPTDKVNLLRFLNKLVEFS